MHTIINHFVRNLPVADLGILRISFPFAIVKEQDPYHWPLGVFYVGASFPRRIYFLTCRFGRSLSSLLIVIEP